MKNIEEFNLQEIIDFLKKNPKTKVNAMISEEQRGYFQVDNEKEYEEHHANIFGSLPFVEVDISKGLFGDVMDEDGEDIVLNDYDDDDNEFLILNTEHHNYEYHKNSLDLKKKIYSEDFYDWINFEIDINWLIEEIETYDKKERLEKTIDDLKHECWSDYTPPEAIVSETLEGIELDSGFRTDTGRNDISWSHTNEYRFSNIDLKFV